MLAAAVAVAVAALLFGSTFLVVKSAVATVDPTAFIAARFLIGGVALGVPALLRPRSPRLVRAGVVCGVILAAGYVLQTIGLQTVSSSVSAFLTYLLVILVPLITALVHRRWPARTTMLGAAVSAAGLWLLTGARPALGTGELLTIGCAVAFAMHIIAIGAVAADHDAIRLNTVQLLTVGLLCLPVGLARVEEFPRSAWVAAAFTGLAASGLALGLQVWGQRRLGPSRTALILMLEPAAAALLGTIAGEQLGWLGWGGAILILGGIALGEVPLFASDRRMVGRQPGTLNRGPS